MLNIKAIAAFLSALLVAACKHEALPPGATSAPNANRSNPGITFNLARLLKAKCIHFLNLPPRSTPRHRRSRPCPAPGGKHYM